MKQLSKSWVSLIALVVFLIVPKAYADEVTDWNQQMLRAGLMAVPSTSPTVMSRVAAMVHAAMFDAVNGVKPRYTHILVEPDAPEGASARAAAVQAAYVILSKFYGTGGIFTPSQQAILDVRFRVARLAIEQQESPTSVEAGLDWGQIVADAIWDLRASDPAQGSFPDSSVPGKWRRTLNLPAPGTATASSGYLQFSMMPPWSMSLASLILDFDPGAPPLLTSNTYAAEFNEVKEMGSATSTKRTRDQTIYSFFWNSATASYLWNHVALSLIEARNKEADEGEWNRSNRSRRNTLLENARLFGQLNVAMSDAVIGCWNAKYFHAYWRPVTAIHLADFDGNPKTVADTTWSPLFTTPAHPEYPSGHSCISGAAAAVLADEFGEKTRFSVESDTMLGVTRSFHSFKAALEEVKNARIFAGIHFRTACDAGTKLGGNIARFVLDNMFQKND